MTAQAAIEALFGVGSSWASLAVFLASQVLELDTFCASDPPSVPTFTASDITDILEGFAGLNTPGYAKLVQLCQVALWHVYCQCDGGAATTPTEPTYPTAPVVSNPGDGPVPLPGGTPCFEPADWFETLPFSGVSDFNSNALHTVTWPGGITAVKVGSSAFATSGTPWPVTYFVDWYKGDGGTLLGTSSWTQTQESISLYDQPAIWHPPFGFDHIKLRAHSDNPLAGNVSQRAHFTAYCGALNEPNAVPCCPPDPNLQALLLQVLNGVTAMYGQVTLLQRYMLPFGSVLGAAHSGLSGQGSFAVSRLLGVQVVITTLPAALGVEVGSPDFHFDVGWISIMTPDGFIDERRVTATTQAWYPRMMADAATLGYSFHAGVVATITEVEAEA
jgi:hypothetical protein